MLVIAVCSMTKIVEIVKSINEIQQYMGIGQYMTLIIKVTGINYVAELSSDICKEAGYATIAGQIIIFGKLSVMLMCVPIIQTLFQIIGNLM